MENLRLGRQVIIISGEKYHFIGKVIKIDENTVDIKLNYGGIVLTKKFDEIQLYTVQDDPIEIFLDDYPHNEIIGLPSRELYGYYENYCKENKTEPVTILEFTKLVNKILNLCTVEKRIDGKKYRIFAEVV